VTETSDRPFATKLKTAVLFLLALFAVGTVSWKVAGYLRFRAANPEPIEEDLHSSPAGIASSTNSGTSPSAKRAPPPQFRSLDGPGRLVSNPNQEGYSASALVGAGIPPWEVYDSEPKKSRWAEPMEAHLTKWLAGDLAGLSPDVRIKSIDCRTSTCLVNLAVNDTAVRRSARRLLQYAPIASKVAFSDDQMLVIFGDEGRIPEDYEAWYLENRRASLADLRRKGPPPDGYPAVPADEPGLQEVQ